MRGWHDSGQGMPDRARLRQIVIPGPFKGFEANGWFRRHTTVLESFDSFGRLGTAITATGSQDYNGTVE